MDKPCDMLQFLHKLLSIGKVPSIVLSPDKNIILYLLIFIFPILLEDVLN